MALTDADTHDRLVQASFANCLAQIVPRDSIYAWEAENFGHRRVLGRVGTQDVVLTLDLRDEPVSLNLGLPADAMLPQHDYTRSTIQRNQDFYRTMQSGGGRLTYREAIGNTSQPRAPRRRSNP